MNALANVNGGVVLVGIFAVCPNSVNEIGGRWVVGIVTAGRFIFRHGAIAQLFRRGQIYPGGHACGPLKFHFNGNFTVIGLHIGKVYRQLVVAGVHGAAVVVGTYVGINFAAVAPRGKNSAVVYKLKVGHHFHQRKMIFRTIHIVKLHGEGELAGSAFFTTQ